MGMKKTHALMTMFAAMAMSADNSFMERREYKEELTDEEQAELKAIAERKRNERNGLTEFKYGTESVWALNRKNADRKAKRKGYL
jgi:predicted transglutaminase-like cysteine proteinase